MWPVSTKDSSMAPNWRAYLVDLDNTLHDYERAARVARQCLASHVERHWGVAAATVLQRYDEVVRSETGTSWTTAREMRIDRLGRLLATWAETRSCPVGPLVQLLETTLLGEARAADGAIETLDLLRSKAPTMIVTEGYPDMQSQIAARIGLDISAATLLATAAFGVRKRDGSAYRLACQMLDVPPDAAVMIGDNWDWDIVASADVGLWQIWVNAHAPERTPISGRFVGRVRGIRDVPALIDRV
jgi:putative hydrolase of the HAD superfamily